MQRKHRVLLLAVALSAGLPAVAFAQRERLTPSGSLPERTPFKDWDAMARTYSSWHGNMLVATTAEPKKFVACKVKELTVAGVTCRRKFGKVVVFGRGQIAQVAARHESDFEWGGVAGIGLVGAIGGAAGYGTAVLIGVGGAALIAAAPLALLAASVGVAIVVVSCLFIEDAFQTKPGRMLYQRSEADEGPTLTQAGASNLNSTAPIADMR